MNAKFWEGRRVFITGHTGFKGSWLSLWLSMLGAEVHGYALPPQTTPDLFSITGAERLLRSSTLADIRDAHALATAMQAAQPEIVLHLAAQPLVRYSYQAPVETYAVNVMGTVHLLEAVRNTPSVRAVVNVTTDKCYDNREWVWGYREDEPMGGHDPYSSSKGCSELVSAAYRASYFAASQVALATARAGNVIGGGDWAHDRLIPDFLRALDARQKLVIRAPHSTRPWQHVLEPLSGYLTLAQALIEKPSLATGAWNFGPADDDARSVSWILKTLSQRAPELQWELDSQPQPHEAHFLKLDSSKARIHLGWQPRWKLTEALDATLAWHRQWRDGGDMQKFCIQQITDYLHACPEH